MKNIFVFFLLIMLYSCNTNKKMETQNIKRVWLLIEFQNYSKDYLIEKKAHLDLTQKENATANMGCNTLGFPYKILNSNEMQFENGFATKMACEDMKLEYEFSQFLPTMKKYSIDGHKLTLTSKEGIKMVFIAQDWD